MSVIRWKKLPIDWKSPQKLTRLIDKTAWSCLFIAGAYLTGQMFMELVQVYAATTTDASVMFNETMTLPPAALCKALVIDTWELSEKRLYNSVLKFFNRMKISKEEFLHNLTWPSYIIDAATNYLVAIESIVAISYDTYFKEKEIYEANRRLWDATHMFLLRHNITHMELQYKYGEEVRKKENLAVQFEASRTADKCTEIYPRSSFLEETPFSVRPTPTDNTFTRFSICWQFPFNEYDFHANESNSFRIIINDSYDLFFITFERGNLYKYTPEVIFNADSPAPTVDKQTLVFCNTVNHNSLPMVNIIPRCQTEEPSPRLCISSCRAAEIRKKCSVPARDCDSASNQNSSSYLNFDHTSINYITCLHMLNRVQLEQICRNSCLPFCSISNVKLDKSTQELYQSKLINYRELRIYIGSFHYVEIKERFLYTLTDFVAAAGGVLGFWLGLNATFFVNLLFIPAMWLTEYYLKARNNRKSEGNNNSDNNQSSESRLIAGLVKLLNIDITGLSHAFLIKKIIEKLFWNLIYFLGSILTIIMCMRFYLNFVATLTTFSTTEISDDHMILPSVTVCLPLVQVELGAPSNISHAYEALTDTSVDIGNKFVDLNKILTKIFKSDYQHIKRMAITKDSLLDIHESWSIELMRVARQYLILFGSFATMETENLRSAWQLEQSIREHYNWEAIELLAAKLDQLSINYNQLLQKFAAELQRYQLINITKHKRINQSLVDYSLHVEKAAFLTDKIVCYWLPTEAISFKSPEEYTNINLNRSLLPGWQGLSGCSTPSIYTPQKISIRVPGRSTDLTTANLRELSVEVEMSDQLATTLNVDRRFSLLQDVKNCSTNITLDECYAKCRISDIEVQCNCTWPAGGLDEGKKALGENNLIKNYKDYLFTCNL